MNLDEKIMFFIFRIAMADATQQKAYQGNKAWLKDYSVFQKCKPFLDGLIGNIFNGNYLAQQQTQYDEDFLNTASKVCIEINREEVRQGVGEQFTFGHTQKLINMMIKYFFIMTYGNNCIPKNHFDCCHCPMDGKMLDRVWKGYKGGNIKSIGLENSSGFKASWSKEKFSGNRLPLRYETFQNAIKKLASSKGVSPIEYDYLEW